MKKNVAFGIIYMDFFSLPKKIQFSSSIYMLLRSLTTLLFKLKCDCVRWRHFELSESFEWVVSLFFASIFHYFFIHFLYSRFKVYNVNNLKLSERNKLNSKQHCVNENHPKTIKIKKAEETEKKSIEKESEWNKRRLHWVINHMLKAVVHVSIFVKCDGKHGKWFWRSSMIDSSQERISIKVNRKISSFFSSNKVSQFDILLWKRKRSLSNNEPQIK